MTHPRWLAAPLLTLFLVGCGAELDTPGEALRLFAQTLDPAFIGEAYSADLEVFGGLAPYTFEVREGRLPPGLELQGGTLRGTPNEEGSYTFTVGVSDANLSRTYEEYTLEVTTAPPAELVVEVPPTEMSEAFSVPVSVTEARGLQALRTQLSWDPARFAFVRGSVRASRTNLAVLQRVQQGQLNVDVAVLGPSLNGEAQLFTFDLRPLEPSELELEARTEYRTREGEHAFSTTADEQDEGIGEEDPLGATDDLEGTDDENQEFDNGSDDGSESDDTDNTDGNDF